MPKVTRRHALKAGAAAVAAAQAPFQSLAKDNKSKTIPFLDRQPMNPNRPMVEWEKLNQWITPEKDFYVVSHYNTPEVDAKNWKLRINGLVKKPLTLTLDDLKKRPKIELHAVTECGGNGASINFMGANANNRWVGTPLKPILEEAGLKPDGIEIVFYGADRKKETIRKKEYQQAYGRSLALKDAFREDVFLAYELNGGALPIKHGFPVRLVVPGWYSVSWVKWLERIEVLDRRYVGRFMGRDYVTIRGEKVGDEILYKETSVSRMNVKSMVGRVERLDNGAIRVNGAAWSDGAEITKVEVKIDDGPWRPASIERTKHKYSWNFWNFDWTDASPGRHTIVSRATDANGRVQPAKDAPEIDLKETYWEANQQKPRVVEI